MQELRKLKAELQQLQDPEKARLLAGFFKTGKGQYGEGDRFLGIMVPKQRAIAKKYFTLSNKALTSLLKSRIHEYRLVALLILVARYKKADEKGREEIFRFYLQHAEYINNWDLVDLSAPRILGEHLLETDASILYRLAGSSNLWERRMALLATLAFIQRGRFEETLNIAAGLLEDSHDLIHKASGWMLREVGKKDSSVLESFLSAHAHTMPRTMLRYAIERLDQARKKYWMKR